MNKTSIFALFLIVFSISIHESIAMDNTPQPPKQYLLKDFRMSISSADVGVEWSYIISGDGTVIHKRTNGHEDIFKLTEKKIFSLLEIVYEMDFFSLQDDRRTSPIPILFDDGMVRVAEELLSDVTYTETCIILPNYKKCVRSIRENSSNLEPLYQWLAQVSAG